jgi:hypothetical protein
LQGSGTLKRRDGQDKAARHVLAHDPRGGGAACAGGIGCAGGVGRADL